MKKKISKKKLILFIIAGLMILLIAGDWYLSASVYEELFGMRYELFDRFISFFDEHITD